MIKKLLNFKKSLLVIFIITAVIINYGCQKENPVDTNSSVVTDQSSIYNGNILATITINQLNRWQY